MAITTQPGANNSDYTTLLGTENADTFSLKDGNLYIEALDAADTITATDTLNKVKVMGGLGNDTVTFNGALENGFISGGKGNDDLNVVKEFDGQLYGGQGVDDIDFTRDVATSTIKGDNGNDTIDFANDLRTSLINGGSDDDAITVTGLTESVSIYGGKQDDTITVGAVTNSLISSDKGDDRIDLGAKAISGATVKGGEGDDDINVASTSTSASSIYGGKGDDSIDVTSAIAQYISGDNDDDKITADTDAKFTIVGGEGDDTLSADGAKAVTIDGGTGDDVLGATGAENNSLTGGAGDDTIVVGNGDNTVTSDAGKDVITVGTGKNTVKTGTDEDTINLVAGTDLVYAGKGADTFSFVESDNFTFEDSLKGDDGTDTILITATTAETVEDIDFTSSTEVETLAMAGVNANGANDSVTVGKLAQAAGITTVTGKALDGTSDETFTVSATAYTTGITLIGSDDEDIVDILTGGAGADSLTSGAKVADGSTDDTFIGGAGNDTFTISGVADAGTAKVYVDDIATGDVLVVTSTATNGALVDVDADFVATSATSNNRANDKVSLTVAAGKKADMSAATGNFGYTITADDAASISIGGSSKADILVGGNKADSIVGNEGNDKITGDELIDTLTGGTGDDTFFFNATSSDAADASKITDFTIADDVLDLDKSAVAGGAVAAVTNSIVAIGASADNKIIVDTAGTGYASFAAAETAVEAQNANTDDYLVIFFNTANSAVEMYADADSGIAGSGVLLNTFTDQNTDAKADTFLAGLATTNFNLS